MIAVAAGITMIATASPRDEGADKPPAGPDGCALYEAATVGGLQAN